MFLLSVLGSYLLYYFIVLSSSIVAHFSSFLKNTRARSLAKLVFFSAIIVPVLISGFRYGIGTDFESYSNIYHRITSQFSMIDAISDTRYEPGWVVLNFFVYHVFGDVKYLFIASSFLIWFFSFKAIYDNRDKISIGIAVLILLCTLYNTSFNAVRQVLAIAVIMLSIKPLLDQKPWKFLLTILFASTFHYSALIFAPAYWIANSKTENIRLLKTVVVPVAFIGMIFFFEPLLSLVSSIDAFSTYGNYDIEFRGLARRDILLKLPVVLLILLNYKKLKLHNNTMYKISLLFIIGIILTLLRSFAPYIDRIALYFDVTQVFLLAAIAKTQTNKYEKFLYSYIIIIYYIAWFTYNFLILGRHGTVPYFWI